MCQYDRKTDADTVWSVIYDTKNKDIFKLLVTLKERLLKKIQD